ncbi:MAG: hypothetical protein O7D35_08355 [Acidobacteria bacterium]|nr:hypothetical protein [Acidobacteriota bacterium]
MNRALWELQLRSLRGRLRRRLRLLRKPRYVIGLVAGLAWMAFWIGRPLGRALRRSVGQGDAGVEVGNGIIRVGDKSVQFGPGALLEKLPAGALDGVHLLVALILAVAICLWWLAPWHRPVLRLREEELSLLLAAPLSRRQIIQYAILRHQPGIIFGSLIMSFFLGSGPLLHRAGFLFMAWLFLSLWDLHSTARHLWHARTREVGGMTALRRRIGLAGGTGLYLVATGAALYAAHATALAAAAGAGDDMLASVGNYLTALGSSLPVTILLAPLWAMVAPFFATTPMGYAFALAAPLLALVAHHEWVVRTPRLFEDAALEQARKRGRSKNKNRRQRRRWKLGRRRQPFPLPPVGLPEVAIVWKNLLQVSRLGLGTIVALGLGGLLLVTILPAFLPTPTKFYLMLALAGAFPPAMVALMCGVIYRHDLRVDLLHADILRAWPLSGSRLVAAEVAGPVISATLAATLALGVAAAAETGHRLQAFLAGRGGGQSLLPADFWTLIHAPAPLAMLLAAAGVLPLVVALAAVSSAIQNLAVLLFPGWLRLGRQRRSGAAQFGQNLLASAVLMLTLAIGLIPGLLLAGLVVGLHFFLGLSVSPWEWPLLGILTALPLAAEAAGLILLAGRRWERFDPSAQTLSED